MSRQFLIVVALPGMLASVGCVRVTQQDPHTTTAAPQPAKASPGPPHRPRHKGGADLSTGLYVREDEDLVLGTAMPVILSRAHLSGDHYSRRFGVGATHAGEWWLSGDNDPRIPWADLILATGMHIHFTRISPGHTQADAVLRHVSSATEFNGARLAWTGSRWEMTFRDGSLAAFVDCQDDDTTCLLVERRDGQGHRIEYVRDASQRLLRMESEGQWIGLEYDDLKRIIRASDQAGHSVSYDYDGRGRLVRARYSSGVVRTYAYDDHDNMTGIDEPGRIIRNWYDEADRFRRQEVRSSPHDSDPYIATARYVVAGGEIVQVDFDEGDGLTRIRYDARYTVSETLDADSSFPIIFKYSRDATSHAVTAVTMTCGRGAEHGVPLAFGDNADTGLKRRLIREMCPR
jgi:YD repeat-containing protein